MVVSTRDVVALYGAVFALMQFDDLYFGGLMQERFFANLLSLGLFQALLQPFATAQSQPVKLRFAGAVNGTPFECGKNHSNIGSTKSTITPSDCRFFVSAVELLTEDGKAVAFGARSRRRLAT